MKIKNKNFITVGKMLMVFLFVGGVLASCSKDKNEDGVNRAEYEQNYFNIQNGEFQGRSLPGSNSTSLEIMNISGNSTVLAGGSSRIHVTAGENAREVIVGVKDRDGYFVAPLAQGTDGAPRGADSANSMEVQLQVLIGLQASENFVIAFAVGDGQGNFSEYQYLPVNIMDAGIGKLKVSLSWDQENDVDLHVMEPNGEHIYFANRNSSNGGRLDLDSNAACGIDNINNENIYYEDDPEVIIEHGEYEVLVDLWSNCNIPANTSYTVRVFYGNTEITPTVGNNPHTGILTPEDESRNSNLISVMKFVIDGEPANRNMGNREMQSSPKVFKFDHDKNNKVFQAFSQEKE